MQTKDSTATISNVRMRQHTHTLTNYRTTQGNAGQRRVAQGNVGQILGQCLHMHSQNTKARLLPELPRTDI